MNNNFNNWKNNANGDINIHISEEKQEKTAIYDPEPVWRSPITIAVLTWLGFLTSLGSLFSIFKAFEPVLTWFNSSSQEELLGVNQKYMFIFLGVLIVTLAIFSLRSVTSRQTRHPLLFNYAISGVGNRLTIEKIKINNCPICNGKMRFYNKPIEFREEIYSDGKNPKK